MKRDIKDVIILATGRLGTGIGFPNLSSSQIIKDISPREYSQLIFAIYKMYKMTLKGLPA